MLRDLRTQICGNCGKAHAIDPNSLQRLVGDRNVIVLPPCACGAYEVLNITTPEQNPGEHAELVRRLADLITKATR